MLVTDEFERLLASHFLNFLECLFVARKGNFNLLFENMMLDSQFVFAEYYLPCFVVITGSSSSFNQLTLFRYFGFFDVFLNFENCFIGTFEDLGY
jgi:hypothetical protein